MCGPIPNVRVCMVVCLSACHLINTYWLEVRRFFKGGNVFGFPLFVRKRMSDTNDAIFCRSSITSVARVNPGANPAILYAESVSGGACFWMVASKTSGRTGVLWAPACHNVSLGFNSLVAWPVSGLVSRSRSCRASCARSNCFVCHFSFHVSWRSSFRRQMILIRWRLASHALYLSPLCNFTRRFSCLVLALTFGQISSARSVKRTCS